MTQLHTVAVPMAELAEVIALQLENGGKATITVTGVSMLPMLRNRKDSVTLIPASQRQKPGNVIFYRRENGRYVLHRIIRITPEGYLCSGDNQYELEPVKPEQVVAVVDGFVRKGRTYTCNHPGYRLYTVLWVRLFFLRRLYIAVRRRAGCLFGRLMTNKKKEDKA